MAAVPLLVIAVLCMAGATGAATQEELLREAIISPSIKKIDLVQDIVLTADLPPLPPRKVLTVAAKKRIKIDGQGLYRMFSGPVDGISTLTLDNLVLTRASTVAVQLRGLGTRLTVKGVTFENMPTALDLSRVTATVTSSKFLRNTGGSVRLISDENGADKVTFKSCEFRGNTLPTGSGAAILAGFLATVIIEKSTFADNSANNGGAIRIVDGLVTIRKSTFSNNAAQEGGGAISLFANDFCSLTIVGSTFKGNEAKTGGGGALRLSSDGNVGSLASVSTTTFENNRAANGLGGALLLQSYIDIVFCRSTFSKNTGNIFVQGPSNTITTTPKADIPSVQVDTDAVLTYKSGEKCRS